MVILAYIRWNSFHSITQPCIIFEFFAIHVPLDFRTFMRCFGCYYFCNLLKDLRLALIPIWTADTLLMPKGNGTLIALVHIRTVFSVHDLQYTGGTFVPSSLNSKSARISGAGFPVRLVVISSTFYQLQVVCFYPTICPIRGYNSPSFCLSICSRCSWIN